MRKTIILFGAVILLAGTVHAQEIDGGVFSRLLCVGPGSADVCAVTGNIIEDQTPGDGLAQTQLTNLDGTQILAAGSVGYDGPSLTPNISAYAYLPRADEFGAPDRISFSGVHWGFQKYTLNGNQATLNGRLSFSRSAQGDPSFSRAAIIAFQMENDVFYLQNCRDTRGYHVLFCLRPDITFQTLIGLLNYQEAEFEEFRAPGPQVTRGNSNAKLTINGSPGDVWFVGSYLHFRNANSTYFDSRNTVVMEFEDAASVRPSLESTLPPGGTAVPAPAPVLSGNPLDDLLLKVSEVNVQNGISNALDAKLQTVAQAMEDLNHQNDVAAVNSLTAFIYFVQAQRGNKIEEADADMLITAAIAAISSIGG